ncbi:elongation factor Tu [Fulvivirga sp. RKSG066]|uniref:EF-Tu C-terminal domain-related protein n=1 Tax=Fulvivirga aurantia TaxID=2529383 RepID=UPI0012BD45AA|nr:elongation factor Tu [Fulvivirga aurantia]MTI23115.1 elongation factor Tu [Fulvivirga aurantia]
MDKITEYILNHYNKEFNKVDFIAELQYLSTENGGRETPAKSGYRPQIKFDFDEMQTSGQQTFIDRETVNPGEKVRAKIKIVSTDYFTRTLIEGMEFEFREGAMKVGTGKIEHIVNKKLEKSSRD